ITIGKRVWVCAESFIGPGVTLNDGCILGARGVAKKIWMLGMYMMGIRVKKLKKG
ncbi:putative colanic acid biosynthesis acetyltransferase, partial [Klebsiella pneumoniae]